MTQIKEDHKTDNSFIDHLLQFDDALEDWFKQRLPLVHRFTRWGTNRISRMNSLTAGIGFVIILIALVVSLWLSH